MQALPGHLQAHHRFLLAEQVKPLSERQEAIARIGIEIAERLQPSEALLVRLETIPVVEHEEAPKAKLGDALRCLL